MTTHLGRFLGLAACVAWISGCTAKHRDDSAPAPHDAERVVGASEDRVESPAARGSDTPVPGRYATAFAYSQHKFITMEHTIGSAIDGRVVVTLDDDGLVRACIGYSERASWSRSKYDPHGEDRGEREHHRLVGYRGTWRSLDDGALELRLTGSQARSCAFDEGSHALEPPVTLRCTRAEPGVMPPTHALVCPLGPDASALVHAALLLDGSPRAGSWELRKDPSDRGGAGTGGADPDARPMLVLGADPGVTIRSQDGRGASVELSAKIEAVRDPQPPPEGP